METLKTYKIIVVDDSTDNLRALVYQLESMQLDIQVMQETNAQNALEIARFEIPDIIITDWEMPDMDGIEFIRALKEDKRTHMIPVIMCTGIMTSSAHLKIALDAGAVDYVRKPIDPVEFEARMRSMLQLSDSFKIIEQQMVLLKSQKETLHSEVHHRVKNNLQVIVSLINLQLSKSGKEGVLDALKDLQSRVMSMSLVHQRFHQTENFDSIELMGYTYELAENVSLRFPSIYAEMNILIPTDIFVNVDPSIPLGLIINEIVSNFYMHCAQRSGTSFSIVADQQADNLKIVYKDNGDGFPTEVLENKVDSFGFELIEILTEQLEGEYKIYNEEGAVLELLVPMPN